MAFTLVGGLLTQTPASASKPKASSPIVIGLDLTMSGPQAPLTVGAQQFFMAYINYVNSQGGINGHPIKVIALDDQGNPAQILLNVERLWSQDHVVLMANGDNAASERYIQSNQVPVFCSGCTTESYSKHYTSIFSNGGQFPAWSAQTAYWIVRIMHRPIKRVAVIYNSAFDAGYLPFIQKYWNKLGASFIDMVPDQGPAGSCTAYILKFKSENVQYIDEQALMDPNCITAEAQLGWTPPLGQGGPFTSEIGQAELIGKPYVGVVAGSPNTLYTGAPINPKPAAADKTLVGLIKKYAPQYASYSFLNGSTTISSYVTAEAVVFALKGTYAKYGKITPHLLVQYSRKMTNFNSVLEAPVASFAPTCKTGADSTIWGFWHYNSHPTASRPTLYMVPTSGPKWVTNAWLGLGKCYLSKQADALFPNG